MNSSNHRNPQLKSLLDAIAQMPTDWALTPCVGKQNMWPKWPSEKLDRAQLIEAVRSQTNHEGKRTAWTGISVITGPLSDGLMAIDFDGPTAFDKYLELSGGEALPESPRWSSGRDGHFQILLDVTPEKREGLKAQTIELPNGDKLELRWSQCSTLPPSIHPNTKKPYYWEKNDCAIAACPDFILQLMKESPVVALPKKPIEKSTIYKEDDEKSLVDILENEILPRLDAQDFYGEWTTLKSGKKGLTGLCPLHDEKSPSFNVKPSEKTFYCFGCGVGGGPVQFLHQIKGGSGSPTGKEFAEVVRELAHKVGVQMPDFQPKSQIPKSNPQSPKPNNVLKHPATYAPEPEPATEIIKYADNLLEEELTPTNQIIGAIAAAKRAGLSPKDFREILSLRQDEQDLDWALIESRENFQRLYKTEKTLINLHEFLPHSLAKALLTKAESDRVDPARILQTLLPVVGATLGAKVAIEIRKGARDKDSWKEYPIFYCVDSGPPSSGKSATQSTIMEPLQEIQDAEQERANEALIEWVKLVDVWKSMSKQEKAEKAESDENPRIYHEKYCTPKKWLLDQGSAQALTKRIAEQESQHGCLLIQDELSGFFEGFDQFTGGKGNQRQFILNAWNKPLRGGVDRVDLEASYFFRSQTLSISGTIQPDIARRVFNVATDADGMVSRFLPVVASLPHNFAKWSEVQVDVYDTMKGTIEKLRQIPETLLVMPPATKDIFKKHWESIRELYEANLDSNPAYAFWMGKQNSYVGRFAIVIHCLENLNAVEFPTQVTPETMRKAVRLSQFYCSQFLLLQSKSAQQQPLEGLLLDILKFIRQSGGQISTRDLCRSRFQRIAVEGKKMTTATAAKLLREIAAAGFGSFEEAGNKKIFTLNSGLSSTVINCHQVDDSSKPSHSKDSNIDCHQMTKVYVSENFEPRVSPPSEHLIDESVLKPVENSKNLEDIQFCHLMTVEAQIQSPQALEFDDSLMTVDDSDDSSTLNVDEIELLEMLQAVVAKKDAEFAKDVRGILKNVCDAGEADRKKVWEALGDASQKIFTELLAVEIPAEVTEPDSLEVEIQKLTGGLVEALYDGPAAVAEYATQFPPENIEKAIALLENLKDWDAVREIRDALS